MNVPILEVMGMAKNIAIFGTFVGSRYNSADIPQEDRKNLGLESVSSYIMTEMSE